MKSIQLTDLWLEAFFRNLEVMTRGGIPLPDAMFLLAQEEESPLQELLTGLGNSLDQGKNLADAMAGSGVFTPDITGMIRVGESTGRLEQTFCAMAQWFTQRARSKRQLRDALAYPSAILLLMLAVIGVLLVKVLPVFDQVYASLGGGLAGIAGWLLEVGKVLEGMLPALLVLAAVVAAGVLVYVWVPGAGRAVDAAVRKHFGDRGISAKFNNARYARALAMGLAGGEPLEEAAALAARMLADIPEAATRCDLCARKLEEGTSLSEAMAAGQLLNAAQCRMLSVGIRSGSADRVMDQIASQLTEQAEEELHGLISRVEPAMVLAASALVGAILLTVMLPLMQILSSMG